tara:strand:+ start:1774 stop:4794 length:3021 start_codon:yes stop_codon:yes gene_type:complete
MRNFLITSILFLPLILYAELEEKYKNMEFKNINNLENTRLINKESKNKLLYEKVEYYIEILKRQEKILGRNSSKLINNLKKIENYYRKLGEDKLAINYLNRAFKISESIYGSSNVETRILRNKLAALYLSLDLFEEASTLYEWEFNFVEKEYGSNNLKILEHKYNLAVSYKGQGKDVEAEKLLLNCLEIFDANGRFEHPEKVPTLRELGDLYTERGKFEQAEKYLKKALKIDEIAWGKDNFRLISTLNSLGKLYLENDFYVKAEDYYLRALNISKNNYGNDDPETVNIYIYLAKVELKQKDYYKAEKLFKNALIKVEDLYGPEHKETGEIYKYLGTLNLNKKLYKEAESFYLKALNINKKFHGNEHLIISLILNDLGLLASKKGEYKKSKEYYLEAISIAENLGFEVNHPNIATIKQNMALLPPQQGLFIEKEEIYLNLLKINQKRFGINNSEVKTDYKNLALHYFENNQFDKAIYFYKLFLKTDFTLIQREASQKVFSDRLTFINSYGNNSDFAFWFTEFGEEGLNLALFSRLNKQGLLHDIEKRQARLLQKVGSNRLNQLTVKLASKDLTPKERQNLKEKKKSLEKKYLSKLPEFIPNIVSVKEISNVIPNDGILIEYQKYKPFKKTDTNKNYLSEERYIALLLKPSGKITAIDLGKASIIENKIQEAMLASEALPEFNEDFDKAENLWRDLSSLIIKPLKESIGSANTLFISADAQIHRIPFSALTSHKGNNLLTSEVNLRLITSGKELLYLSNETNLKRKKSLVVANPSFNWKKNFIFARFSKNKKLKIDQKRFSDLSSRTWNNLPWSEWEGNEIAKLIDAKLFIRKRASALAIQKEDAPYVLHVASHAFFLSQEEKNQDPLARSGIVLAGANNPEKYSTDDGYLTAKEVSTLNLQGTEMVVISGCDSNKGEIYSGEGIYGLKRAIAVAGARSSLLSLWKVDDKMTAYFMKSFYEKLIEGKSRSDALALTQKEFRDHPNKTLSHPYYWAAFQLSGDWRTIKW